MLVISADADEKVVLEAWSLSIGWSGELRVQVNDQECVLGPPSDKVKTTGAISQSQACRAAYPPLAQPALDSSSDAPWGGPRQVLKVSAVMLRSLHSMLQTMEMLPVRIALAANAPSPSKKHHCVAPLTYMAGPVLSLDEADLPRGHAERLRAGRLRQVGGWTPLRDPANPDGRWANHPHQAQ